MKIAYIDNEKAQVRQWYRILGRLRGDQLQITVLKNAETDEVLKSTQYAFCFVEQFRIYRTEFFQFFFIQ